MSSDKKIFFGLIGVSLVLLVGLSVLGTRQSDAQEAKVESVAGIQTSPETYDFGNVPINGGIVTKEYEIKNTTDKTIKVKKIVTSCMCTTAAIKLGDNQTRYFGMEMPGDANPAINFEIPAGETATASVQFDPAAHGPAGVGPFDRVVTLSFSDPVGIKQLTFNGTVIN